MGLNFCMGCMNEKPSSGACPYCGFQDENYLISPRHLPLGTILNGKYLVGRAIGEGGFGITYIGRDLDLNMKLAIKEYYPNQLVTRENSRSNQVVMMTGKKDVVFQDEKGKFLEEARCLARFWGLPGIVAVKDYFQENGTAYIAMEFVEGQTLEQVLSRQGGRMNPDWVLRLMDPIMASLEKVHQSGLIHRDISPDNIMVEPDNRCKLIDFGAARDFTAEGRELSVILRPQYAPWEQYGGRGRQGPWTDVYALCATIYRAVTGRKPDNIMSRVENDQLKSPSELGIPMPDYQEAALMKGLALFAQDRFQTVGELRVALMGGQNRQVVDSAGYGLAQPSGNIYPFNGAQAQPSEDTYPAGNIQPAADRFSAERGQPETSSKSARKVWLGAGAVFLLLLGVCVGIGVISVIFYLSSRTDEEARSETTIAVRQPVTELVESETSESADTQEDSTTESNEDTTAESNEETSTEAESISAPNVTMNDVVLVVATSSLSEYNMTHGPERLIDGDLKTAWVEGADGQGQGESVSFLFEGTCQVTGFCINAGYQKSMDLYQKNSRPAVLRVSSPSGFNETYLLADVFAMQEISLGEAILTDQITFTIESVYPGGKYEDTVISEITLY